MTLEPRPRPTNSFETFEKAAIEQSIPARFEEQVARDAGRLAVKFGSETLTYGELNRFANRIAQRILSSIGRTQQPVALLAEQGTSLVAAVLGILKAGHFYVPLDTSADDARQRGILKDADARLIVSDAVNTRAAMRLSGGRGQQLDADSCLSDEDAGPTNIGISPQAPAYIYYTSGSTGRPKGVVDCHRNVLHNVMRYTNSLHVASNDRFSLLQAANFSGAVSSTLTPLLNGAAVFPFDFQKAGARRLGEWLIEEEITIFHSVPGVFRVAFQMLERPPKLRVVRLEGDQMTTADWELFRNRCPRDCLLVNGLGATECGIVRQYFMDSQSALAGPRVPVGYAVEDMELLLLSDRGQRVPSGEVGEIAIRSAFLAHYWKRPDLDQKAFHVDSEHSGMRIYRTGDLGRARLDGAVEYLGRTDFRLKVRGQWIDVAEVEAAVSALPEVDSAAVAAFQDSHGESRLAAYVVTPSEPRPTVTSLRRALLSKLPEWSVPSRFVFLEKLPLDANGKLSRKSFPTPGRDRPRLTASLVHPRTATEKSVAEVWCRVLDLATVGIEDNFFDLGGDSLHLANVQQMLETELARQLALADLLECTTVRALGEFLDRSASSRRRERPTGRVTVHGPSPATVHQEGRGAVPEIAVVGMAGRFPGAANLTQFWENLVAGRETVRRFSEAELAASNLSDELVRDPNYIPARGVLDGVEYFDASFFGYSVGEAKLIDPQHRLWLECAWEALEDAGCDPQRFSGSIGVFAGCRNSTYLLHQLCADTDVRARLVTAAGAEAAQILLGNDKDFLPLRTSHKLNLTGPSINVQSACSTSLVAVSHACQRLAAGETDVCLAGAVSVAVPSIQGHLFQPEGIASPDGHCRTFDAGANGTVFGDGVGVIVLKRLADALANKDPIDAVIRGWAVNNNGARSMSFTAPSVEGQAQVIRAAQRLAGVDPGSIGYVEAHGTGTSLGDAVEVAALTRAFQESNGRRQYCGLGSVKTNIGHVDTAAGIAGLIKAILCLRNSKIPPSLHFRRSSPEIDFGATPFYVVDRLTRWTAEEGPRRAGVSAFGFGGTNCHVVIEEAPPRSAAPAVTADRPVHLLMLSAKSEPALHTLAARYRDLLMSHPDVALADIAFTANTGRAPFEFRLAAVASDPGEAAESLNIYLRGERCFGLHAGHVPSGNRRQVAFLFGSGGSERLELAKVLYRHHPAVRGSMDRCWQLAPGKPSLAVVLRDAHRSDREQRHTQLALFALQLALCELWQFYGIAPRAFLGHGVGEHLVGFVAGTHTLEEAARLASESEPASDTLNRESRVALLANRADGSVVSHLAFGEAVQVLENESVDIFVELGLETSLIDAGRGLGGAGHTWLSTYSGPRGIWEGLLDNLAQLASRGVVVDWEAFDHGYPRQRVHLPPYPFERKRCWYEPQRPANPARVAAPAATAGQRLLGRRLRVPHSGQIRFESELGANRPAFLADHRLFGVHVFSASALLAMLEAAAHSVSGTGPHRFEELLFIRPLCLPTDASRTVQLLFTSSGPAALPFQLLSSSQEDAEQDDAAWVANATGRLIPAAAESFERSDRTPQPAVLRGAAERTISGDEFYSDVWALGSETGLSYRWIETMWAGAGEATCRVAPPTGLPRSAGETFHPGLLEACFQTLYCCGTIETSESVVETGFVTVPFRIGSVTFADTKTLGQPTWCCARRRDQHGITAGSIVGDLWLFDEEGVVAAFVEAFELRQVHRDSLRHPAADRDQRPSPSDSASEEMKHAGGDKQVTLAKHYLSALLGAMLDVEDSKLDYRCPLIRLGVDSLMALRLSHRLEAELGVKLPIVQWLGGANIDELAFTICMQLGGQTER